MSTTIDQRVVEMRFDNKQFEQNVSTTMSTLDKLKKLLNFDGASKGLENVNSAAKSVNMTGLGSAVEAVTMKFSALEVMGVTALVNLTNSAVNAGKRIVSALTIEPITSGMSEYETKMGSIQTILANTQHEGTTLDDVTAALEELNLYADKTIYNFQEMTRNIGTFTAAGVDLNTSVESIKGIANLAAVSGSTSQQASTAMYQLSQALAAGKVSLMDWNSVVNAGMGGKVFQDALIRTSELLDTGAEKAIKTYGSFRESLTKGEWLTTEVLTETLKQLSGAYTEADLISQGFTEEQAAEITKLARTAEDAATKVKAFTQLFDTLKESAQSGWAQTWELIFGDFEEAKEFFTSLSTMMGGLIESMSNYRNKLLGGALDSTWDKLVTKINDAGHKTAEYEEAVRSSWEANGKTSESLDELIEKHGTLEKAIKKGAIPANILKDALAELGLTSSKVGEKFSGIIESLRKIERILGWGSVGDDVKTLQTALEDLGYSVGKCRIDGIIGPDTTKAIKEFQEAAGIAVDGIAGPETLAALEKAGMEFDELAENTDNAAESYEDLVDNITKKGGRELFLEGFANVINGLVGTFRAFGRAWAEIFPAEDASRGLFNALEGFNKFTESLRLFDEVVDENGETVIKFTENGEKLVRIFKGILAVVDIVTTIIGGGFKIAFKVAAAVLDRFDLHILDVAANIGDALVGIRDFIDGISNISGVVDFIVPLLKNVVGFIKTLVAVVKGSKWFANFCDYLKDTAAGIGDLFKNIPNTDAFQNLVSIFNKASGSLLKWTNSLRNAGTIPKDLIAGLVKGIIGGIPDVLGAVFDLAKSIISGICDVLGIHSPSKVMIAIGGFIIAGLIRGLIGSQDSLLATIDSLSVGLWEAFKTAIGNILDWIKNIDFGAVMAAAVTVGMLVMVRNVAKAFEALAAPLEGLQEMFESIGGAFDALKGRLKAATWEKRARAILVFALAIGVLAASVFVLSKVEPAKLWNAVGVVAALAAVILALSVAIDKMGATSGAEITKFSTAILAISGSLLLVAYSLKMLSGIDSDALLDGVLGLVAVVGGMVVLMASTRLLATNIDKVGGTLIKMAVVMAMLVGVVKLASTINAEQALKGGLAIVAFTGVLAAMMLITRLVNKDNLGGASVDKVGGTLIKMTITMLLMITVIKLAATIDGETALKGGAAIIAFGAIMAGLLAITRIANGTAKVGGTLLAMTTSMLLMAAVVKIVAGMPPGDIAKGILVITAFGGIMTGLVAATKLAGQGELKRLGMTLMMISVSIGILAVISALLGMMDLAQLAKGVIAVTILGGIMTAMIWATKGAVDCKGNLIVMTVAIALLAASVAALSLIDTQKLIVASASLTTVLGMFALIIKSSSLVTGSMKTLIVMTAAIVIIAGVLLLLSSLPIESSLATAASLSMLLLSISVACKVASTIPVAAAVNGALGLAAFIGIMAAVVAAAGALSLIPGFNDLIKNGGETLGLVGYAIGNFVGSILGGFSAGTTSGLPTLGKNLSDFMTNATGFISGMSSIRDADILPTVKTFAEAIGVLSDAAAKNGQSGFGKWLFGDNSIGTFSEEFTKVGRGLRGFVNALGTFDETTVSTIKSACNAIKTISEAGANINGQSELGKSIFGDNSLAAFSEQFVVLAQNLKGFATNLGTFDESTIETIKCAANAIKTLAEIAETIPAVGGWADAIFGDNSLATFGTQLPLLATNLKQFALNLEGFGEDKVTSVNCAAKAIKTLAEAADSLPNEGGWAAAILGDNSLATFGSQLPGLGTNLNAFATNLGTFDDAKVKSVKCAGDAIMAMATAASEINGQPDWAKKIFGDNSLATFGSELGSLGTNLGSFAKNLGTFTEAQVSTVKSAVNAIKALTGLADADLKGAKKHLEGFGEKLGTFGTDIKEFCYDMPSSSTVESAVTGIQYILSAIDDVSKANSGSLAELATNLKKVGGDAIDKFISAFTSNKAKTDIKKAAGDLADKAVSAVKVKATGKNSMESAGKDLGNGLVSGINAKQTAVYNAAYALGQKAVQGEKDGQQSKSPSKLTIQAGKWFGEGLVIGIQNMGDKVYSAGHALGDTAVKSLSSTVSRIAAAIDSDVDVQPTIRPVLDLSDIRSGAGAISGILGSSPSVGVMSNISAINTAMNLRGQNGGTEDVVSAIDKLRKELGNIGGPSYTINGITYDDGSGIATAVKDLTRYARMERRV